jgi:NAD(P)-dependent dehydrogenase (short-subunit alcohol dehydrogenase family)
MKLVIITGGSKGLGLALCQLYLAAGWQVLDISRSGAMLALQGSEAGVGSDANAAKKPVMSLGMQSAMQHLVLDLAHPDAKWATLQQKFSELAAMPWRQVVFLNNAGRVTPIGPLPELNDVDIVQNLQTNLLSGIRIIASFARHFADVSCPKTVVSLSSGAAHKGYAGWSLYCAAKAGMENFIRALALEQAHAKHPLTCITFGPGVIDTDMQADIRASSPDAFPDLARFQALHEQKQLRSAQNVAQTLFALLISQPENGRAYTVGEFD